MSVILRPVITEKSMADVKNGKYTFRIAMFSDKTEIKKEVKDKFKVDVLSVSTSITKKRKKRMGKGTVTEPAFKKAVVKIGKEQKIDLFDLTKKIV